MSQIQSFFESGATPTTPDIQFVQGNSGAPIGPNPTTFTINILGDNTQGINIAPDVAPYTEKITALDATTAQKGVTLLADNAETIDGTVTTKAITPDDLKAKLGTQTLHGIPYGNATTGALQWLAEATNGQIPIGSNGLPPVLANITSTDGSIAVTNGPGTIDLAVSGVSTNYTNVTSAMSPYVALPGDYFISVDASGGAVTILLPDSPTANTQFVVKDRLGQSTTNNITVTTVSGVTTIDAMTSYTFIDDFESVEILFHGTNYEVF